MEKKIIERYFEQGLNMDVDKNICIEVDSVL